MLQFGATEIFRIGGFAASVRICVNRAEAARFALFAECVMLRKQKRAEGKEVLSPFPRLGDI